MKPPRISCLETVDQGEIARLKAALAATEQDTKRLNYLDKHVSKVVEGKGYDNPAGEWVANEWIVDGPYTNVRQALDALMNANSNEKIS